MNSLQLKSIRQTLGLEIELCAKEIGGVTERTWRRWEHGHDVPEDVERQMWRLIDYARTRLDYLAGLDHSGFNAEHGAVQNDHNNDILTAIARKMYGIHLVTTWDQNKTP